MPKVVTKVRTGGEGFVGEDLRRGRRRRPMSAVERKFTCIASGRIRVLVLQQEALERC